jgi:branched-chain amino acid transport system permease protein
VVVVIETEYRDVHRKRKMGKSQMRVAVFILAVIVLPSFVTSNYFLSTLVFIAINSILGLGLFLLTGLAGQISLGQSAFFGVGAYAYAIFTTTFGFPSSLALFIVSPLTAGIVAVITGIPVLRFHGHILAIATFGVSLAMHTLFVGVGSVTGGHAGIPNIPHLSLGHVQLHTDVHYYYLAWGIVLLLLLLSRNIIRSRVGRAAQAIHDIFGGNEEAAMMLGVNPMVYKLQMFILCGMYAGLAGGLYASYVSFVNPSPFNVMVSLMILVIIIVGGVESMWGAVIGAAAIFFFRELMRFAIPLVFPGARGEFEIIGWGILLIVTLLLLPRGLIQLPDRLYKGLSKRDRL